MTLLSFIIGGLVGLVLGLTGAGGSLFAVPLLMLGLGLAASEATGLALGAVAASALWGLLLRLRAGQIIWLPALILALAGALMAPVGRLLALQLSETALMLGFSLLVLGVAWRMWRQADQTPEQTSITRAGRLEVSGAEAPLCPLSDSGQLELKARCLTALGVGGLGAGLLSGLFGVGGGFVIVPLLVLMTRLPMPAAVATSLAVIAIISSAGFASYLWLGGGVDLARLGLLAAGGVFGMWAGSKLAARIAGPSLQRLFVVLMLALTSLTYL